MEREATMSWRVDLLERQLEFTHHESQYREAEATGAWAVELRVVKRANAAERELDAMKAHLAEIEVALQKSLEALEAEQKA